MVGFLFGEEFDGGLWLWGLAEDVGLGGEGLGWLYVLKWFDEIGRLHIWF